VRSIPRSRPSSRAAPPLPDVPLCGGEEGVAGHGCGSGTGLDFILMSFSWTRENETLGPAAAWKNAHARRLDWLLAWRASTSASL
jgi:hypothetical protein